MSAMVTSPDSATRTHQWRGVIEEYRDRLPVTASTPVISLREGGTPLVPAPTSGRGHRLRWCT